MDKVEYMSLKQIADNPKYPFTMSQLMTLKYMEFKDVEQRIRKLKDTITE